MAKGILAEGNVDDDLDDDLDDDEKDDEEEEDEEEEVEEDTEPHETEDDLASGVAVGETLSIDSPAETPEETVKVVGIDGATEDDLASGVAVGETMSIDSPAETPEETVKVAGIDGADPPRAPRVARPPSTPVASKSAASKPRPLPVNDEAEAAALSPARMKTRQPNSAGRCTIEDAMKVALGDVITVLASDPPNAKAFHGEVVEVTRFEACSSDEESDNGGGGASVDASKSQLTEACR